MTDDKLNRSLPANNIMAKVTNHFQRTKLIKSSTDNTIHLTLKMTSAQVVETSVTNNSSSQNYTHPDDDTIRTTDTPGFKPFTISQHCCVQHVARVWPACCDLLWHVGCCCPKFEDGQIFHAAFVDVAWCCIHLVRFVQYPTCHNTSQQGGKTRATCCAQQCCDMLRSNVAIVWPELVNAGTRMLRSFIRSLTFLQSPLNSVKNTSRFIFVVVYSFLSLSQMEITNDIQFLLPIMVAIMVAKWVGDFATHPLYHALLELKCIPFLDSEPVILHEGSKA